MNKTIISLALLGVLVGFPLAAQTAQEPNAPEQTVQATPMEAPDPGIQASFERGYRAYRNRNFREALTAFTEVAQAEPDRADVHYLMGYCHYMLKEFQQSVDAFQTSFEKDPAFDPRTIYQKQ
jgi:tetratricopeptide (TPR) repeat protein